MSSSNKLYPQKLLKFPFTNTMTTGQMLGLSWLSLFFLPHTRHLATSPFPLQYSFPCWMGKHVGCCQARVPHGVGQGEFMPREQGECLWGEVLMYLPLSLLRPHLWLKPFATRTRIGKASAGGKKCLNRPCLTQFIWLDNSPSDTSLCQGSRSPFQDMVAPNQGKREGSTPSITSPHNVYSCTSQISDRSGGSFLSWRRNAKTCSECTLLRVRRLTSFMSIRGNIKWSCGRWRWM